MFGVKGDGYSRWFPALCLFAIFGLACACLLTIQPDVRGAEEDAQSAEALVPGPANGAVTHGTYSPVPPAADDLTTVGVRTADHRKFEILQQEFATGPDVTRACLTCHTEAAKQIHRTVHWRWLCPHSSGGATGKASAVINNFCIALPSNEPRCTSCHVGYGWSDKTFDFSSEENVDCLVCHDQTKTYKKFPTGSGHPAYKDKMFAGKKMFKAVDLSYVAKNIGKPTRHNCGVCHFFGGGGEGVKHGDMDYTLFEPSRSLDVHMESGGQDFTCQQCHTTVGHEMAGCTHSGPKHPARELKLPGEEASRILCESCHSTTPHESMPKMDDHTDKVACQACHVPTFARIKPTKMWWDWSKAGEKTADGKPITRKDADGNATYMTKKGEFRWEKNVVPEYYWYNGDMSHHVLGDKVDPGAQPVPLFGIAGSADDPFSRIWPFKVHRGIQPYDPVEKTMVVVKLFGKKGTGAYWAHYDWKQAIDAGMKYCDTEWSGQYDWINTETFWPITHMIAPKEDTLACNECHSREGRLANLAGFYMPGRDHSTLFDTLGGLLILLTLLGVGCHAVLRIAFALKGGRSS